MHIRDNMRGKDDCDQQIFTVLDDSCQLTIRKYRDGEADRDEIHFCFHSPGSRLSDMNTIDIFVADNGTLQVVYEDDTI